MQLLDLVHRWAGGVIGLVLAVLGLSGAILVHKESWIWLPHAGDARIGDPGVVAAATEKMLAAEPKAQGIIYATDGFGLHQVRMGKGAGAYADQAGGIVSNWGSQWERPELWIFDLHHHLFTGDAGETVIGIAGLAAILFVITGAILWWRTRRTFTLRLWPKRMSRPMIVMHHRDLGIVMAPLLLLSAVTGTMMIFQPFANLMMAPFGSLETARKMPKVESGPLAAKPDWGAMVRTAHATFPDAQIRILSIPRKPGEAISIRMKQAAEWLPNGRSVVYFDAADGRLLATNDAQAMPMAARVFNGAFPLHAAKVGGVLYQVVMTLAGLAMALLGSLAVWSFWFKRPRKLVRAAA